MTYIKAAWDAMALVYSGPEKTASWTNFQSRVCFITFIFFNFSSD